GRRPVGEAIERAEGADDADRQGEEAAERVGGQLGAEPGEREREGEDEGVAAPHRLDGARDASERARADQRGGDPRSPRRAPAEEEPGDAARGEEAGGREE